MPEYIVLVRPHGNSKKDKPYRCTIKSTRDQLEEKLKVGKTNDAIGEVFKSKGGLLVLDSFGLKPSISSIQATGTDGENTLVDALAQVFLSQASCNVFVTYN